MPPITRDTLTLRDQQIVFRNFAGAPDQFNKEGGKRGFSLLLDEPQALVLQRAGWNVKPLRMREDDTEQRYHLPVAVSYKVRPPRVWMISDVDPETGIGRNKTMIPEEGIGMFDVLEFTKVDLSIIAYDWEVNGKTGRKAYLEAIFATLYESPLEREYADLTQLPAPGEMPAIEAGISTSYDFDGEVVPD
jgi:hypothetical protein